MGPFVRSYGCKYILVAMYYVFKWVEVVHYMIVRKREWCCTLKNIFSCFGIPRTIINEGGSHFYNKVFSAVLEKYGENEHKVDTPYHHQMRGQSEVSNREIKIILAKFVNANQIDWSRKLDDSLWAYCDTFKILIGVSPYQLVFIKACHLPLELYYKAFWALKCLNLS